MGLKHVCFLYLLVLVSTLEQEETKPEEFDEAVSVEAETVDDKSNNGRNSKQYVFETSGYPSPFFLPQFIPQFNSIANSLPLPGTCITSKGIIGNCIPYRQCYPAFNKIPGSWDNWIFGMKDTCSYLTEDNRQMVGVCCQTSPEDLENAASSQVNATATRFGIQPYFPQISNWPPPLPTHPPDHTIPPLPTHPPSPGYPGLVTTAHPPMAWPPTLKPIGSKPKPKPTTTKRPFTTQTPRPTTTKAPSPIVSHSCGAKNGYQDQERIVGGHNADVNEWPWIAALFNAGRQFCGGSLIDNIHILSAAHCVAHMSSWDVARLTVRLGDHNIRTNSEVKHVEKRVKRVVRHRGFDSRTLYNDIAILTLDSPVEFNQQIRPLCLPTSSSDYTGTTGTVIGWGSLRESGPQPAILQEVNIPIWNNRDCKLKYGHAAPGGIVDHMLCAGQANRDSCSGDSGGPLMINNGKWTQVGIVSWGIGCGKGQYPGVYTRVEKFLPWINKNLK